MDRFGMQLYVKLAQIKQFLKEERGAVDIVAIVVLIAIAVMLALFFRDQISSLLSTLFGNINEAAAKATEPI